MLKLDCTNQASGITYGQKSTFYIYIPREIYAQIYVYIYTHYISWLYIYIYIFMYLFISLVLDMNAHTYSYTYIYIYMSKWDGFCNATW